ncbi:anti-sigma regulatory factor [Ancylothrix sp. C2]|uniref:ATP-binding protein n=1 Tax=Ancylothrix sp. D3o TaxID=2953691 RepID=UPI0021BB4E18|nr:anti-sigma regulatory factor [Ancylothrix sp. D3o]MCT7951465.1 anti-sigma regulatory factor [Ancylothrix sp. D3o]
MFKEKHLTVQSDLSVLTKVQKWFEAFCAENSAKFAWPQRQVYAMELALAEGFTNAVRHAHQDLPPATPVKIDLALWDDRLEIRIWDRGKPFNPDLLEEPKPGTLQEGGYGWFLLRRLADKVLYERHQDRQNCLLIVKYDFQQDER